MKIVPGRFQNCYEPESVEEADAIYALLKERLELLGYKGSLLYDDSDPDNPSPVRENQWFDVIEQIPIMWWGEGPDGKHSGRRFFLELQVALPTDFLHPNPDLPAVWVRLKPGGDNDALGWLISCLNDMVQSRERGQSFTKDNLQEHLLLEYCSALDHYREWMEQRNLFIKMQNRLSVKRFAMSRVVGSEDDAVEPADPDAMPELDEPAPVPVATEPSPEPRRKTQRGPRGSRGKKKRNWTMRVCVEYEKIDQLKDELEKLVKKPVALFFFSRTESKKVMDERLRTELKWPFVDCRKSSAGWEDCLLLQTAKDIKNVVKAVDEQSKKDKVASAGVMDDTPPTEDAPDTEGAGQEA